MIRRKTSRRLIGVVSADENDIGSGPVNEHLISVNHLRQDWNIPCIILTGKYMELHLYYNIGGNTQGLVFKYMIISRAGIISLKHLCYMAETLIS